MASKCRPKQKPACCFRWQRYVREGERKLHDSILAWKDAQIATFQASMEWRDAWDTQLELQNEEERVLMQRTISCLERMNENNEKIFARYQVSYLQSGSHSGASE